MAFNSQSCRPSLLSVSVAHAPLMTGHRPKYCCPHDKIEIFSFCPFEPVWSVYDTLMFENLV